MPVKLKLPPTKASRPLPSMTPLYASLLAALMIKVLAPNVTKPVPVPLGASFKRLMVALPVVTPLISNTPLVKSPLDEAMLPKPVNSRLAP